MTLSYADLFAKSFYEVYNDIVQELHREYWFKGGRGSTKSAFISKIITLLMVEQAKRYAAGIITRDELGHALVYRKFQSDCEDSVYAQFTKTIGWLGFLPLFKFERLKITLRATGQTIRFRGCDDETKQKSVTPRFGSYKWLWFEEGVQFNGIKEVRSVIQSVRRGGKSCLVFFSYNPPRSHTAWVNVEAATPKEGRLVHQSDYRAVPIEWLGEDFVRDAEALKKQDPEAYEHEYLGKETGTGAEVFSKLKLQRITPEMIAGLPRCYGLDFGFENDPCALTEIAIDNKRKIIYIYGEWVKHGVFEEAIYEAIKARGLENKVIIADSAESRAIARLQAMGCRRMTKCWKSADSIDEGYLFLRKYTIIIDPFACPVAAKEFPQMAFVQTRDGSVTNRYVDKDNHTIDSARYALENYIRYGGLPRQYG